LTPDDFGIMALAGSVYALVELIRAFGFDTALIQKQNANRGHYDTAWTMQVIFSLAASALLVLISNLVAEFYNDERLVDVLKMMAIIIMINGFDNIGIVEFRKQLNFHKEFYFRVIVKVCGFCVTIPLAWYWRSYWALLFGMLTTNLVSFVLSYIMQSYRPRLTLVEWKELLGFSSWLMLNNMLSFVSQHAQNFILGKVSGSGSLGVFSVANDVAMIVSGGIIAPINRAAYPGYSKVSKIVPKLKQTYIKTLEYILILIFPFGFGVVAVAPVLVPVMLGDKWESAIVNIQLLSVASILIAINASALYVFLAVEKQKINTKILLIRMVFLIPSMLYLSYLYGVLGVSISVLLTAIIEFPITQMMLNRVILSNGYEFIKICYRPFVASLIMLVSIYYWHQFITLRYFVEMNLGALGIEIFIGFSVYMFFILGLAMCFNRNGREINLIKQFVRKCGLLRK